MGMDLVGIRSILAEGKLAGSILGGRRTNYCDFVDNRQGLTLDRTKQHPMEHCMEG